MALDSLPIAGRVLLTAGHVVVLHGETFAAAARALNGVGRRFAAVLPGGFSIADPVARATAKILERTLPIERLCELRLPTLGVIALPSREAFLGLLETACARSELMAFAACVPLVRAVRASAGNLGLEAVASLGKRADIAKRTFEVIKRETLVIRITEELVLPCLATIEALAEVGLGRALPAKRSRSLGEAAFRLKKLGLDATFVNADFWTIRNGAAHAGATFDPTSGVISFRQPDDSVRELPAELVAQTLMFQPIVVQSFGLLAMNFGLDRYLGRGEDERTRVAGAIRGALRLAANGRFGELRQRFSAGGDSVLEKLISHPGADLASVQAFAVLWR